MFLFCYLFLLTVFFGLQQGSSIQSYKGQNPAGFLTYQEDSWDSYLVGQKTLWIMALVGLD